MKVLNVNLQKKKHIYKHFCITSKERMNEIAKQLNGVHSGVGED